MLEIEKIQALINLAETELEKRELVQAEEALSNAFHKMIGQTQEYLTNEDSRPTEPIDISKALSILKHYGDQYDIEFPEIKTKQDMLMYVITYARQIIFDRG